MSPKRTYLAEKPDIARHVAEFLGIAKHLKGAYLLKNGDWAADAEGITGDELLTFVNTDLFPTIKARDETASNVLEYLVVLF
ncbi:hypothetical protein LMG28614_05984 [Paraburkholderia ultramafica]|uniref:Uncharacterized protein n=1 Tax=Paraburkholderia ultramafica TaxID=1544867 RepID=A0A6S7BLN8_9BURK|nr:hypothetical protein [Paraburkholderia ultramafica]CAB3804225.1 hypothetical protein LMG28614_05984 [Paraburkholderia ultramafica]